MSAPPPPSAAAGWYPDPDDSSYSRYWTGERWEGKRRREAEPQRLAPGIVPPPRAPSAPPPPPPAVIVNQGPGVFRIAGGCLLAIVIAVVGFIVLVAVLIAIANEDANAASGFKGCGLRKIDGEYARVAADDTGCALAWKVARPYIRRGVSVDVRNFRCKPPHVVGAHTYKGRCSRGGQRVKVVWDV